MSSYQIGINHFYSEICPTCQKHIEKYNSEPYLCFKCQNCNYTIRIYYDKINGFILDIDKIRIDYYPDANDKIYEVSIKNKKFSLDCFIIEPSKLNFVPQKIKTLILFK